MTKEGTQVLFHSHAEDDPFVSSFSSQVMGQREQHGHDPSIRLSRHTAQENMEREGMRRSGMNIPTTHSTLQSPSGFLSGRAPGT